MTAAVEIPGALAERILALANGRWPSTDEAEATQKILEQVLQSEEVRRGARDAVSGGYHVYALTQGPLLQREYDLSTHGHVDGWRVGAVVVDPLRLIAVNQEHGFATGDAVLRATARTLEETFPTGKVVRIHSDAFAVVLPPSSEVEVTAGLEARTQEALRRRIPEVLLELKQPTPVVDYTVSLLSLTVVRPSHWQVLGPLVWAECERTHVLGRSGAARGVQRRTVVLDASVPATQR